MMPIELSGPWVWLAPLLVFAGTLAAGLLVRVLLLRGLERWARSTSTRLDDVMLDAVRWPSVMWVLLLAAIAAVNAMDLPGERADSILRHGMNALLVLSITIGASRLAGDLVGGDHRRADADGGATTGLLRTMVTIAVFAIGLLVMLGTLGIRVVPLLGALGVGGLAAGLALQPTLTNLFAGFQIATSQQFRIGHRVRLASGEEGFIIDIAWRSTTLRTPQNYLVVIPNARFADTIITNYSMPEPEVNLTIPIAIEYGSDPKQVHAALFDEAQRLTTELADLVQNHAPVVRLHSFGESSENFTVVLRAREYDTPPATMHTIYVRLYERLRRERIAFAYPTRTLRFADNGAETERDARDAAARGRGAARRGSPPASTVGSADDASET